MYKCPEIKKKIIYFIIQKTPIYPIADISQNTDCNYHRSNSAFVHTIRVAN